MPIVQVIIDDSTNKTITGVWVFENGGKLAIPHGASLPEDPVANELFWHDTEKQLYKRNATNTAWDQIAFSLHAASHAKGGSDEVTLSQDQVTGLVTALEGKLPIAHVDEIEYTHPRVTNLMCTGLLAGGQLSINKTDPTKFDIAEGVAIFVDNWTDPENPTRSVLSFNSMSGISPEFLETEAESYIYINSSGEIVQRTTEVFGEEERTLVYLGWVSHVDNTEIDAVFSEPRTIVSPKNTLYDFLNAFGPFNIEGNEYAPAGNNLKLKRSAGKTFDADANYETSPMSPNIIVTDAANPVEIIYYYRDENGEWVNNNAPVENVDPNHYDTGTGLAEVPTGKWTIQPVMFYAPWGTTDIQYGQRVYDTYAEARADIWTGVQLNPYNSRWDTFRGWLFVKQGATDLSDPEQAVFVSAGKLGLVSISSGGGSGGEANTASNIGSSGIGVFHDKLGVDLRFRKLNPNSSKLSITLDTTNKKIDFDVVPENIAHQSLSGAGTYTHAQLDAHVVNTNNPHSVTKAQVGLGNVTNDAQLKRAANDFTSFTEKSSPIGNDILLLEDSADGYNKKCVKLSALGSGNLKQTAFAEITTDTTSTSSSWADLLSLNITTGAGYLAVFASAGFSCSNATARLMGLRLVVDGTPIRAVSSASASTAIAESFSIVSRVAVSAGAHTVKLQWRVSAGYTIRCRPVAYPDDEHCSLLVMEVTA